MTIIVNDRRPKNDRERVQITRGDIRRLTEMQRELRVNASHVQPAERAQTAQTSGAAMTGTTLLNADVSAATVANTVAETSVYSTSIPGGSLGTANKLRLRVLASHLNNTGAGQTIRFRVKYGATTVFDVTTANLATAATSRAMRLECEIAAAGATGAQIAYGHLDIGSTTSTLTGVVTGSTASTYSAVHASVAENSITAQTLEVTVQHGAANAALTFTAYAVHVEVVR